MKVSFLTFGCKVNQYDTELLKEILFERGIVESDIADIVIINSCTVTEKVDKEIFRKIVQIKNKNKKIILTGCVSKNNLSKIENLVDIIIPAEKKFDINYYPTEIFNLDKINPINFNKFLKKDKAFIKIEEGCNKFCSYCIVPFVRGSKIKIREKNEVLNELKKLLYSGFKEIVFTGVNLGLYGASNLIELLKKSIELLNGARIRLSSIGPVELEDKIIDFIAENSNKICPHFHLSLQSGDDYILKLMNRNYTTSFYEKKCNYILKKIPFASITTDVIAGFPGEKEKNFQNTYNFLKNLPLTRFHVFSYSDRSGTKAEKMFDKVKKEVKKERVEKLISLGKEKEKEFIKKNIGFIREVLFENNKKGDFLEGYTENYIRVISKYNRNLSGKLVKVKIKDVQNNKAISEII